MSYLQFHESLHCVKKNVVLVLGRMVWGSLIIIIMVVDAVYEMALGQPIDCCVSRTKERVWGKQCWNSDGQAWDASLCVSCTGL